MSRQYVLEIRRTVWVLWGYGPSGVVEHVEPACTLIDVGVGEPLDFPFELPETTGTLPAPVEYERREGLAWRFTNRAGNDTGWKLVESDEAALTAAQAKIDQMPVHARTHFQNAPVVHS
jgi:hypothetical protein